MVKEDYREKIEEDRQQVEIEAEKSRLSRSARKNKPRKSYGMKILLVVFIFIPLSFLIYFKFFYFPEGPETASKPDKNEVQVETTTSPGNSSSTDAVVEDEEKKKEEELAAKKAEEEKKAKEAAKKAEEERLAKEEAERKAAAEAEKAKARTHVVQTGDTLYSIAMKYYKDPSAVDKIVRANGIVNNNITVGSTLILP